ncbi:hypothetical protein ACFQ0M_25900 [Kitasatospora aburaviensis]
MGPALMGAAPTDAARRTTAAGEDRAGGAAIDCLVTRHPHLPRDRMGHRLNDAGRWLITEAVARLYGCTVTPGTSPGTSTAGGACRRSA